MRHKGRLCRATGESPAVCGQAPPAAARSGLDRPAAAGFASVWSAGLFGPPLRRCTMTNRTGTRIRGAKYPRLTDTRNAREFIGDVDRNVVGQKILVPGLVRRGHGEDQSVATPIEEQVNGAKNMIYMLDGQRIGAGGDRPGLDLGRHDIGKLRDRQPKHHHGAGNHEKDRDDHGHDGPVDKELRHRFSVAAPQARRPRPAVPDRIPGLTCIPSLTFCTPPVTTRWPGVSPRSITRSVPYETPGFIAIRDTRLRASTTATWY